MKKPLLPVVAAAALAPPASAFAWGGGHDTHGNFRAGFMGGMKLTGTGTSFGATSASVTGSSFHGTLATTWSSATTKTFMGTKLSCAPATASITVGTTTTSYTGKTCSWTRNGTTKYAFFGKASNRTAAVLGEDGTTVRGAVFQGRVPAFSKAAFIGMKSGHCDHH